MLELLAACLLLAAEPPAAAAAVTAAATAAATAEPQPAAPGAAPDPAVAPVQAATAPASVTAPAALPAPEPVAPLVITASMGLERSYPGGLVDSNTPMNDLTSAMVGLRLDFGLRIAQRWMAAFVVDLGFGGTPGWPHRAACTLDGVECTTSSVRTALEGRYAFSPAAERTWWVGAGLGAETLRVTVSGSNETRSYLPTYGGTVLPRLSCGWDSRVNRYFGWGFYGAFSAARYGKISMGDSTESSDLPDDPRGHSWLDLGVRVILFP